MYLREISKMNHLFNFIANFTNKFELQSFSVIFFSYLFLLDESQTKIHNSCSTQLFEVILAVHCKNGTDWSHVGVMAFYN